MKSMISKRAFLTFLLPLIALLIYSAAVLFSQNPSLIRDAVDENRLVTLTGNTRPEANAENDLGAASDDLPLDHMLLQLKRSPEQEQAAQEFIAELHNPKSPHFHKWLTAAQFGEQFGAAEADLQKITAWLQSHGFAVNSVSPSRMVIDFSGNAGQVRNAFHTSIHHLQVNGAHHIANVSDPQIPAALSPAIAGIVSLSDFMPHAMKRPKYTYPFEGGLIQAVVPADLATIYDLNPLYKNGITGKGQTIAVIEDTDLYSSSDWTTFRSVFGLSQYSSGSLTTLNPPAVSGPNNCLPPGVLSDDEDEAILDTEWSSAAAPGAAIIVAACMDTSVNFGGFIAMQNMINSTSPPQIISISYGACEALVGAAANTAINAMYQQATSEGISVFVAAGDEGAASCDGGQESASHGVGVSAYASTPNNVAVGGTDFGDTYAGTNSQYWSNTNSSTYGSALSYVPEIPWNDSCAGILLATYSGYATGYGLNGFCNSSLAAAEELIGVVAGSGGPSNCASGSPPVTTLQGTVGVATGTCQGYAKPSWQTGVSGIPNDSVRDLPDVSMFAADGVWGHYYVFCWSDVANGGSPCFGSPSNWAGGGGTSFASPIMAGIQALVNQSVGGSQGNPNFVYYPLAAAKPAIFHSVTQGDIVVNCNGIVDCYGVVGKVTYGRGGRPAGTSWGGALSTSDTKYSPAYAAGLPWNFANGLGSVDATMLVQNWIANP
jgi:subtilase family serine protease